MFNFFSFRKKQKNKENQLSPLIISKLDRIIELLEKQQLENPQNNQKGNNLHFDHVQVDHLENIVFRLDNIEIDELSGKLIIGNNITGSEELAKSLIQKTDKEKAKQEAMSETESSDEAQMMKTAKGYRFRNNI
ncbi:hypothetical protein BIV60_21495 [Bacillus sp. MUM 116]|uniref:hypothetical protein n=1 Tax=Bacillus sp. MUM 116 TaxID=1678002 RepID=UPI0008F5883F|nr:hypothetical protein [Bacillus sp. MUM 116]OIK10421.1 hypothetical protein BIV60_21495 [Bacillus sp. MUM 116]